MSVFGIVLSPRAKPVDSYEKTFALVLLFQAAVRLQAAGFSFLAMAPLYSN
jgi:hypothetical protein